MFIQSLEGARNTENYEIYKKAKNEVKSAVRET